MATESHSLASEVESWEGSLVQLHNISVLGESSHSPSIRSPVCASSRTRQIIFKPFLRSASVSAEVALDCSATFEEAMLSFAQALHSIHPSADLMSDVKDTFTALGPLGLNCCELRPRGGYNNTCRDSDCYATYEMRTKVEEIVLSLYWEDQGWGQRKGKCDLKLLSAAGAVKAEKDNVLGLCLHEITRGCAMLKRGSDSFVDKIQPGDSICVWFTRGDGEGHKLKVEDFKLEVRYEQDQGTKGCTALAYSKSSVMTAGFDFPSVPSHELWDPNEDLPPTRRPSRAVDPAELHRRLSQVVMAREGSWDGGEGKVAQWGERVEVGSEAEWRQLREWALWMQGGGGQGEAVEVELLPEDDARASRRKATSPVGRDAGRQPVLAQKQSKGWTIPTEALTYGGVWLGLLALVWVLSSMLGINSQTLSLRVG